MNRPPWITTRGNATGVRTPPCAPALDTVPGREENAAISEELNAQAESTCGADSVGPCQEWKS